MSLRAQLAVVQDAFSLFISQDPTAVQSFNTLWASLQTSLDAAIDEGSVDEDVLQEAHELASRVEIVANGYIELYEKADVVADSLQHDLEAIFANMTLESQNALPLESRSTNADIPAHPPRYLALACSWLLQNLHNPYPSKGTKMHIADTTDTVLKDVDHWFTDARRRIGWNALRLKSFSNKRSKIVAAATRFYCGTSNITDHPTASVGLSYDGDFIAIEQNAKRLFAKYCPDNHPTSSFDSLSSQCISKKGRIAFQGGQRACSPRIASYPSPARTPDRSSSPTRRASSVESSSAVSRKRRLSSESSTDDEARCPKKRQRFMSSPTGLLSPASTVVSLADDFPEAEDQETDLAPSKIPGAPSLKRKRSLSEIGQGPSKRTHNDVSLSRHQRVSDPLPVVAVSNLSSSFSDWLECQFKQGCLAMGVPDPILVTNVDDSTSLEVDCFQYDFSPYTPELDAGSVLSSGPESPLSLSPPITAIPHVNDCDHRTLEIDYFKDFEGLQPWGSIGVDDFSLDFGLVPYPALDLTPCSFPSVPDLQTHQFVSGISAPVIPYGSEWDLVPYPGTRIDQSSPTLTPNQKKTATISVASNSCIALLSRLTARIQGT